MDFQTETELRIAELRRVIPYCKTREEAEEIQAEIEELEDRLEACPSCGSYETENEEDDPNGLACRDEYHNE